jgi:hypothetical protein
MNSHGQPEARRGPRDAEAELVVLARWEEHTAWLLDRTTRWPKVLRMTLTQRVENEALDVVALLIRARYRRRGRLAVLEEANLGLERLRYLLRFARGRSALSSKTFEAAIRGIDEVGRMLHGWRQSLAGRTTVCDTAAETSGAGR